MDYVEHKSCANCKWAGEWYEMRFDEPTTDRIEHVFATCRCEESNMWTAHVGLMDDCDKFEKKPEFGSE